MEGDSALSSIRLYRDPKTFGAFPLRGKVLNVSELPNSKIIANEEIVQLMAALGLKLGEKPENLRYGKIYIYCDADVDGDAITALLINFFNKFITLALVGFDAHNGMGELSFTAGLLGMFVI